MPLSAEQQRLKRMRRALCSNDGCRRMADERVQVGAPQPRPFCRPCADALRQARLLDAPVRPTTEH